MFKIRQSEEFLGRPLGSLLKTVLPLMKNVFKPLAKSFLIPLRLTAVSSARDAVIQKSFFGSGMTITTISNKEMGDILKQLKCFSETIKYEAKEQKDRFRYMLLAH